MQRQTFNNMMNLMEKNVQVVLDPESEILNVWLEGFIPYEKMIEILHYEYEMIRHYNVKKCVIDLRKIRVYAPGIPEYINNVWFPQIAKYGVNQVAFIIPEDIFGAKSMSKANKQMTNISFFEIKHFKDKETALNWMKIAA